MTDENKEEISKQHFETIEHFKKFNLTLNEDGIACPIEKMPQEEVESLLKTFCGRTHAAELDQETDAVVKEMDNLPDIDPCENSETLCQLISEAKEKSIKRIQRICHKDIPGLSFSLDELDHLESLKTKFGFETLADYARFVILNAQLIPGFSESDLKKELKEDESGF
jgi:hypothetical protein